MTEKAAIWTDEEVKNLQEWQNTGFVHPFTWDWEGVSVPLIPTKYGWVVKENGPIVQDWAHPFMLDGSHLARLRIFYDKHVPSKTDVSKT